MNNKGKKYKENKLGQNEKNSYGEVPKFRLKEVATSNIHLKYPKTMQHPAIILNK